MKKKAFYSILLAGLATLYSSLPAAAANVFMVQLGSFDSQQDAEDHWSTLRGTYPNLFDGLSPNFNKVILQPGNAIKYRTQAGPITAKDNAQALCTQLAQKGEECFVVESAMYSPGAPSSAAAHARLMEILGPTDEETPPPPVPVATAAPMPAELPPASMPEMAEPASSMPWQEAAALPPSLPPTPLLPPLTPDTANEPTPPPPAPVAAAAPQESVVLPWLAEPQPVVATAPAPVPENMIPPPPEPKAAEPMLQDTAGGQVQVGEAMRVPVTGKQWLGNPTVSLQNPSSFRALPSQSLSRKTLWAQLGTFENEQAAKGYWYDLFGNHADRLGTARVRYIKPYMNKSQNPRMSLRIGPFGKAEDARYICAIAAPGLKCDIVSEMGRSTTAGVPRARRSTLDSASRYDARRAGTGAGNGMVWIQLGSYNSPHAAENAWDRYMETGKDSLASLSHSVARPPMGSNAASLYRLRAGPFSNRGDAQSTCGRLMSRGIDCIVVGR